MANEVKPIVHPTPVSPAFDGEFHLGADELFLFDCVASEVNKIAGTEVDLYLLNRSKSKRDALYDEMNTEAWDGPFRLMIWVEWTGDDPELRAEGFRRTWISSCWIARVDLEKVAPRVPDNGDIVHFWPGKYYSAAANSYNVGKLPTGYFFTITDIDDDGHMFDEKEFVGFKCELARNTEFTPERRLTNK